MSTAFADVKPWPEPRPAPAGIGSNSNAVPIEERVVADFLDALGRDGLLARVEQLTERGLAQAECADDDAAGRIGDFVKLAGAAAKAVEAEREKHNRPLLTAQRTLKGKADALVAPLSGAVMHVRLLLDGYMAEQRRVAAERQRQAEEQARAAREAVEAEARRRAEEAASSGEPTACEQEPLVQIEPVKVAEPVVRGDYGARVGTSKVWKHELVSVRQLPDRILKHARVVEAIDKVVAAEVRGGAREIKGARIYETDQTVVR